MRSSHGSPKMYASRAVGDCVAILAVYLRELDRLKGTKILFKYGEERSIGAIALMKRRQFF